MELVDRFFEYLRVHGPPFLVRLAVALAILAAGYLAGKVAAKLARRALLASHAQAFSTVVPGAVRVVVLGISCVMALDQLGLQVGTLLAGAGIVGLAIGFGSQAVVRDVVTGLFLILDGAIKPGDVVEIGDKAGTVEHIGLRMTEVRGEAGELTYIANGTIASVTNRSRGWARISVDVPVAKEADLSAALAALQRVADDFAAELGAGVLEPPAVQGVWAIADDAAVVRIVAKVKDAARIEAELALKRRVHEDFLRSQKGPA